jgi:hypothetical protein
MRHLLSLVSIFTLLTTLHAQVPSYVPTDGLVGWWPFNGNANDESGNGNNGTVNGANLVIDRFGNADNAYDFNSSTITVPHNDSLGFTQFGDFTVTFWFKKNSSVSPQHFMGKRPNSSPLFNWQFACTDNQTNFGSGLGPGQYDGAISNAPQPNGQWTFLCGTYSNSVWSLYENSIIIASSSSFSSPDVNCDLTFGNSGGFEPYIGLLDDIGIWNRALTSAEIQALYTSQPLTPCISPDPVSFTGLGTSYTTSDGPVTLTGTPAGGVFIGPGVTGSTFAPAAAGAGTHGISYTYLDGNNCVNTFSQCTEVTVNVGVVGNNIGTVPGGVKVFPNPNRGQLTVELELIGLVSLQVFDARGALVHNEVFTATGARTQRTLDLSTLARGSYTLQVQNGGGAVSQTVVVE